jgi:hypothetical protein
VREAYDVFVSYSSQDLTWVESKLIPRLEAAELVYCLDKNDFMFGVSPERNMEEAVTRSKCTLLVVTQAWAKSQFAGFEGLFAKGGDKLVIPLLIEEFSIPAWILSSQSCADLRDAARADAVLERLVEQLLQTARPVVKATVPAPGGSAGQPPVPDAYMKDMLRTVCARIDRVGDYKDVHNQFHVIQYDCQTGVARNLERKKIDVTGWEELDECANALNDSVVELQKILPRLPERQRLWYGSLCTACTALNTGVRKRDVQGLKDFRRQMNTLLSKDWVVIITRLNEAASNLLPELSTLGTVRNSTELLRVRAELEGLVDCHDRMQQLDSLVRSTDPAQPDEFWWPDIREWRSRCKSVSGPVDPAIDALSSSIERGAGPAEIRKEFKDLESKAGKAFQRADTDLKKLCDQLRKIDGPFAFLREAS